MITLRLEINNDLTITTKTKNGNEKDILHKLIEQTNLELIMRSVIKIGHFMCPSW